MQVIRSCLTRDLRIIVAILVLTAAHPLRAQKAASPAPATLADLAQHRNLWPAQVTLNAPVKMTILSNGKEAGSITSPPGSTVDLVAISATGLQIRVMQATAIVPAEQTDLWKQVAALAQTSHGVVTSTPPPVPTPAAPPPPTPSPAAASAPTSTAPVAAAIDGAPLHCDCEIPPRDNFDKAAFRFWSPNYKDSIRGVIVLVPGANGDGRGTTGNRDWQALAQKYHLALVGVCFQSKGHQYSAAAEGSGDALCTALKQFAQQAGRPEIAQAPIALYGESAGGQFNYDFALWKPERVICFVVNKGGYYSETGSRPPSRAAPGLFILGMTDEAFRVDAVTAIWTEGRSRGALWALARQPHSGHEFSKTAALARAFFDPVFKARLSDPSLGSTDAPPLQSMDETHGWIGDLTTHEIHDASTDSSPDHKSAWFPDENSAKAWKEFVSK